MSWGSSHARLAGWPRRPWVVLAGYISAIVFVVFFCVLLLNARPSRRVDVNCNCAGFTLPSEQVWRTPRFETLHGRGFNLKVTGFKEARLSAGSQKAELPIGQIQFVKNLARGPDEPSLFMHPEGQAGESLMSLPPGAVFRGAEVNLTFGPAVSIEFPPPSSAEIEIRADRLRFSEITRMRVAGSPPSGWPENLEAFSLTALSNQAQLVSACLTIDSERTHETNPLAEFRFRKGQELEDIYSSATSSDAQLGDCTFLVSSALDPNIKIDQRDPSDQPKGIPYDLKISADSLRLHSVQIVPIPSPQEGAGRRWALRLALDGKAKSVLLGEKEIVPSRLQEFLAAGAAHQGILGLVFAFVTLVLGTVLTKLIEALVKLLLPASEANEKISGATATTGRPPLLTSAQGLYAKCKAVAKRCYERLGDEVTRFRKRKRKNKTRLRC